MKITILGAGIAGHGIAQAAAQNGQFNVIIYARNSAQKGLLNIRRNLWDAVNKKQIRPIEAVQALSRIKIASNIKEAVADSHFIIEAITENLEAKICLLKEISEYSQPNAVIVSNTSTLSINVLAHALKYPGNFCGMHFFSPTHVMRLVEVTKGSCTNAETINLVCQVSKQMHKEPIILDKEIPGFIVNRILACALNEAVILYYGGVDREIIDNAVYLGLNWPVGPLELIDCIGVDTFLSILEVLSLQDNKFRPCPELREMVSKNWLGKKSGKGFYDYPRKGMKQ